MDIKKVKNPLNKLMQDRRSIRKYDPSVKISKEEMSNIIQDAMTAPSGFNLQPWRFVVIDSDEGKELIKPYMTFNQIQHETSSAIIVVFIDNNSIEKIDDILAAEVKYKLRDEETKEKLSSRIKTYRADYSPERLLLSQMLDCGLICMQLMLSAKAYGYDTNPIGAFDRENFANAIGMDKERYFPALVISIGKAAEEGNDTTRFSVNEITQWK